MALKEKLKEAKEKFSDPAEIRKIREKIEKVLKEGKATLIELEKKYNTPENRAKVEAKIKEGRAKILKAKEEFKKRQKQAVDYTQKNPEKALVAALAAGAVAGALWKTFHRKK
ncbi:MAG TPA: hypothetical protein VHE12_12200 [bacterium]|nr:hypothetical protein [bacterium]